MTKAPEGLQSYNEPPDTYFQRLRNSVSTIFQRMLHIEKTLPEQYPEFNEQIRDSVYVDLSLDDTQEGLSITDFFKRDVLPAILNETSEISKQPWRIFLANQHAYENAQKNCNVTSPLTVVSIKNSDVIISAQELTRRFHETADDSEDTLQKIVDSISTSFHEAYDIVQSRRIKKTAAISAVVAAIPAIPITLLVAVKFRQRFKDRSENN